MRTVVITGGSRGIGAAAVKAFADRGDRVFFLYEKEHDAAKAVAKETGATPICCDVADNEAVKKAFSQIPDVDILICNAGICHYGLMSQMPEEDWDREFAVNVKGMYTCINAATPFFLQKQAGCVITVSSMWFFLRGGLLRHQGCGHRSDEGFGPGAWTFRHSGQLCCPRCDFDGYVRFRLRGNLRGASPGNPRRPQRHAGRHRPRIFVPCRCRIRDGTSTVR